jgi:hypothetical protein
MARMRITLLALAMIVLMAIPGRALCQSYVKWDTGYPKTGDSKKIYVQGTITLGGTNKLTSTKVLIECWRKYDAPNDKNGALISSAKLDITNNKFGEAQVLAGFEGVNYWITATVEIDYLLYRTPASVYAKSGGP